MLKWIDIIRFANYGNPEPDKRVEKTEEEWKSQLLDEQFRVTRQKGTERAGSSELCSLFEPGKYACVCCSAPLFDAEEKFDSGTGWPSFTQPIKENALGYRKDLSLGMRRIEVLCNTCDAHLGHVFLDGPGPSGLRFCINAVALQKIQDSYKKSTFGGGCFWCTEALFDHLKGVVKVESGFSGGTTINPTYREVCSGRTGHAEVVNVIYDPAVISFEELAGIHLTTHDPTIDRQKDHSQYRSIIFYRSAEEKEQAQKVIAQIQDELEREVVTELKQFEAFYPAEDRHQDYYASNPEKAYCRSIIDPKLKKLREEYGERVKV